MVMAVCAAAKVITAPKMPLSDLYRFKPVMVDVEKPLGIRTLMSWM